MASYWGDLRKRKVFKVAVAYAIVAWLLIEMAATIFPVLNLPEWTPTFVTVLLVIGFPVAMIFVWAHRLTPRVPENEKDAVRSGSVTRLTGRKLDLAIIGVLAIAVVYFVAEKFWTDDPATESDVSASIAVLPFAPLSSGEDDRYFADGLTEEILNSLAQLPELQVTARTSSFFFKEQNIPVPEIAARLDVAHVVEGSVRRDGERVRITAQLIRASDGFHLWSQSYDRTLDDVFAVQQDIAEKVAAALNVVLDDERLAQMRAVGIGDPQAFIAYQKGVELYALAHPNEKQLDILTQANSFFEQAIEQVPDFSDAYLRHSDYYSHLLLDIAAGRRIDGVSDEDIVAAREALHADFDAAVRYARVDERRLNAEFDRAFLTGNWQGLSALIERLLNKAGCSRPLWLHATALPYDTTEEVRLFLRRQIECDPLQFFTWALEANALIWLGEFDAAVDVALTGLEIMPQEILRLSLIRALIGAGRYAEADAIIEHDMRSEAAAMSARISLAATRGDLAAASTLLATFRVNFGTSSENAIHFHSWLGERETANRIAGEVDARPFGYMILALAVNNCFCGAPFDLEVTPNFASMLEDAGLSWPPAMPIERPLKNW